MLTAPFLNSPSSSVWLAQVLTRLSRVLARRQTMPLFTLPWLSSGWVQR
ncbi:hypothetical protein CDEF62S_00777 [Castellaniella defragrans]